MATDDEKRDNDEDTIEVPGAEVPTGVDDDPKDPEADGSPGTLEDLVGDTIDHNREDD